MTANSGSCVVCGDAPSGNRYGPQSCLKCIVFFRRAIQNGIIRRCDKRCRRKVGFDLRSTCRSCRLQDCLEAGMNPNAIQLRDKLGPRKRRVIEAEKLGIDTNFGCLLRLQRKQRELHERYTSSSENFDGAFFVMIKQKSYHHAKPCDIELALKIGFQDAIEWAKHFTSFWSLKETEQNHVISEYGISFILIDQAYKSACRTTNGFWLLQNDSFFHTDNFLAMPNDEKSTEDPENLGIQAKHHKEFVTELLENLKKPFFYLKIDNFECVILKSLLLLTSSIIDDSKFVSKCMSNLMVYSCQKSPKEGMIRFGEIILLMRSVRSAVKSFYNQTKISTYFDTSNYDCSVRNYLLS